MSGCDKEEREGIEADFGRGEPFTETMAEGARWRGRAETGHHRKETYRLHRRKH